MCIRDSGYTYDEPTDKWNLSDIAADLIYLGENILPFDCPNGLNAIYDFEVWKNLKTDYNSYPILTANEFLDANKKSNELNFILISIIDLSEEIISKIKNDKSVVLILETQNLAGMAEQRRSFFELIENEITNPVILKRDYANIAFEDLQLYSSTDLGSLLIDAVSYTHLRAHETVLDLVCRLLLEKKNN